MLIPHNGIIPINGDTPIVPSKASPLKPLMICSDAAPAPPLRGPTHGRPPPQDLVPRVSHSHGSRLAHGKRLQSAVGNHNVY